jgi:hypothetical protein
MRYRGSRKHILDWCEHPRFLPDLLALAPTHARLGPESSWLPIGYRCPDEPVLDEYGPAVLPNLIDWAALKAWWLRHPRGANTPNWDMALACEIEAKPGLILIEAKAHAAELKVDGKAPIQPNSINSAENDRQIRAAIAEAAEEFGVLGYACRLSADSHYQLANRLAFTWKLASLGLPTILIYLGFLGDTGLAGPYRPLSSPDHWRAVLTEHARQISADCLLDTHFLVGTTPAWVVIRSRPVLEPSPNAS